VIQRATDVHAAFDDEALQINRGVQGARRQGVPVTIEVDAESDASAAAKVSFDR